MHTVEQAKELWCPMVRIARREEWNEASGTVGKKPDHEIHTQAIVGGCNTDALGGTRTPASCRCIADKCAMWRWGEGHPMRRIVNANVFNQNSPMSRNFIMHDADENEGEPACYIETEESADARRRGYCGMANRPGVL